MPKYELDVAHKDSGDQTMLTLDAAGAREASDQANRMGFLVNAVRPCLNELTVVRRAGTIVAEDEASPRPNGFRLSRPDPRDRGAAHGSVHTGPAHQQLVQSVNVHVHQQRGSGNSLAVSSLAFGGVALVLAFVPLINLIAILLAFVAIACGLLGFIVSLLRGGQGILSSIGGVTLGVVSIALSTGVNAALLAA